MELLPDASIFNDGPAPATPTLKQAVLLVMDEQPERAWRAPEIIAGLAKQKRLPSAKSARQMVRNRLVELSADGGPLRKNTDGSFSIRAESRNGGLLQWPDT